MKKTCDWIKQTGWGAFKEKTQEVFEMSCCRNVILENINELPKHCPACRRTIKYDFKRKGRKVKK